MPPSGKPFETVFPVAAGHTPLKQGVNESLLQSKNLSDEPVSTMAKASEKLMRAGKVVPLFDHEVRPPVENLDAPAFMEMFPRYGRWRAGISERFSKLGKNFPKVKP